MMTITTNDLTSNQNNVSEKIEITWKSQEQISVDILADAIDIDEVDLDPGPKPADKEELTLQDTPDSLNIKTFTEPLPPSMTIQESDSMIPWEQVEAEDIKSEGHLMTSEVDPLEFSEDTEVIQGHVDQQPSAIEEVFDLSLTQDEEIGAAVNSDAALLTQNLSVNIPASLCDEKLLLEIQTIPNRMGFRIGEVAELLGIKQYVLRYWETEFELLRPKKASNKQRMFTKKDVENAFLIRKLLHRDRYSIEGARNALKDVKTVVRKEREIVKVYHKMDHVHEKVQSLIEDIRTLRRQISP